MADTGWPDFKSDNSNELEVPVYKLVPVNPTPKPKKYNRLGSVRQVRFELASVYRAVRNGEMASGEGTRLTYILTQLANMIVDGDLEAKVEDLERRQ